MKYTIAIAALLGLMSSTEVNAVARRSFPGVTFVQSADESESEYSDEDENLQLKDDDHYAHWMNGFGGYHTYIRDVPDRFEEEKDDRLMHSLYTQYAYEGKTDGKPNGHFFLNHANGRAVSREVVMTHLGLDGSGADGYLDKEFEPLWRKYDVLEDGKVDIDRMP
jgi:hypothetical protein